MKPEVEKIVTKQFQTLQMTIKKIILCFQIKNSIFSWKDPVDAIQISLVVISNIKIMNMQLQILLNSEMWILTFPAQASASTENKPAHYLWRDTQIHAVAQELCLYWYLQILVKIIQYLSYMDVAIPSTGKC